MKKKLLAGILALALCSTNMPLQTIFAEEFTSGNSDVVSEEETPEIFTNEEQEAAGETDEELSVFSSEEVPEFNDAPDEAMAAAENEQAGEIDLADNDKVMNGVYTISSAGDYKFTCSNSQETANRIVIDGANIYQVFFKMILPLSVPGIVSVSIFNFIQVWNNLLFPLIFISDKDKGTISMGLLAFFGEYSTDYSSSMAGICLTTIPVIIAYIFFQEKIENGLMSGAVKG